MPVPTLDEQIQIEEILAEASSYGLRHEVCAEADRFMDESPEMEILDAYIHAFEEWIK